MLTFSFTQLDSAQVENYTSEDLMAARDYALLVKRTARGGGFGEVAGRMLRETCGYKFDSADVNSILSIMAEDGFLSRYSKNLESWYAGLNKSAGESTLKGNAKKFSDAKALASDDAAFQRLVKALRILCKRNQDWRERGNHLSLPMNGHKALLDLFCIAVTNNRRLSLATN